MTSRYPFKFLDSYTREDHDFFFGREKEVNELYEMVFQADLLLLYGASGTGKSSLIQCGLAGKFQSHDWLALNIRRGSDSNESLEKALSNAAGQTVDTDLPDWLLDDLTDEGQVLSDTVPATPLSLRLRSIYLRHFKPLYLVFDQFEELYTLGNKNEEQIFINTIRELLRVEQPVKIILSIREEYLGHLYEFERQVPELLRKKLRIEPMYSEQVTAVITKTGAHADSNVRLAKGEEEAIASRIFEIIHGENNSALHISLPYLQVLLDKYYLHTTGDQNRLKEATLTLAGLNELGEMGDVLRDFLDEQVQFAARKLGYEPELIWKLLSPFVTLDGTKEPLLQSELNLSAPLDTPEAVRRALDVLVERRVLRYSEQNKRYEIAHDTLARQLHARRSDEEIAKLEIQRLVKTTVSLNEENREYFSEKYLSLIDVYRKELQLSDEEEKWVEKSRERIRDEARELLRAAEEQAEKEALLRQEAEAEKQRAQEALVQAEEARRR
ncbi:MAG: AAA family ATPase, partial [Bacteroidota bacterium]